MSDPMRIAFFVHRFPTLSETFVTRQIVELLDLGHDVHIFSERSAAPRDRQNELVDEYDLLARTTYLDAEMPAESGYWSMPVWPLSAETWIPGSDQPIQNFDRALRAAPVISRCLAESPRLALSVLNPDEYGNQALSLESLYHLSSLLDHGRVYDVLHAHFGPVADSFRFARTLFDAPLVATFHGYDFSAIPRIRGDQVYERLFREADAITGVSQHAIDRLAQLGCPTEKLHVLHMGVSLEDFRFRARHLQADEPVRILTVGRLVEKKGVEYALRAVAKLRKRYPQIRYDIIGDGPLASELELLVRDLELAEIVVMHGARDSRFVRQRMDEAHLFLLPSVTAADGDQEGIPVSLMEAQASGLPVLTSQHSGIGELVEDGRSGFLVPERDVEGLADRLTWLVANAHAWPAFGSAGQAVVESRFRADRLAEDLVALYEDVRRDYQIQRASQQASCSR